MYKKHRVCQYDRPCAFWFSFELEVQLFATIDVERYVESGKTLQNPINFELEAPLFTATDVGRYVKSGNALQKPINFELEAPLFATPGVVTYVKERKRRL